MFLALRNVIRSGTLPLIQRFSYVSIISETYEHHVVAEVEGFDFVRALQQIKGLESRSKPFKVLRELSVSAWLG